MMVRFFSNGLVIVLTAILVGVAAMAGLIYAYTSIFDDQAPSPAQEPEPATLVEAQPGPLEPFTLSAERIPAPVLSRDDGSVLGYVFLDVTIEVMGETAYARGESALDAVIQNFTQVLKAEGAGMPAQPGVVDYERLTETLFTLTGEQVGPQYVGRVVITENTHQ